MAASAKWDTAERQNRDNSDGEGVLRRTRRWFSVEGDPAVGLAAALLVISSLGFFTIVLRIAQTDPDYFTRLILAKIEKNTLDPITTGATSKPAPEEGASHLLPEGPMPVPLVFRSEDPKPQEFKVVMIFNGEALVATNDELFRLKVGSTAPVLGQILSIEKSGKTGLVKGANMTLQSQDD